jgi:hypothetical protein
LRHPAETRSLKRCPEYYAQLRAGWESPDDERPAHDLMLQAMAGLTSPPELPKTTIADLAAGEQIVSAGLALLLGGVLDVRRFRSKSPHEHSLNRFDMD